MNTDNVGRLVLWVRFPLTLEFRCRSLLCISRRCHSIAIGLSNEIREKFRRKKLSEHVKKVGTRVAHFSVSVSFDIFRKKVENFFDFFSRANVVGKCAKGRVISGANDNLGLNLSINSMFIHQLFFLSFYNSWSGGTTLSFYSRWSGGHRWGRASPGAQGLLPAGSGNAHIGKLPDERRASPAAELIVFFDSRKSLGFHLGIVP